MLFSYAGTKQSTLLRPISGALHVTNMKRAEGEIVNAKNGHLSFEIAKAKSSFFPIFCDLLSDEFGFIPKADSESFVSEIVGDAIVNGIEIGWGWDNWSGAYILAFCERGDKLIELISEQINAKLRKVNYANHLHM